MVLKYEVTEMNDVEFEVRGNTLRTRNFEHVFDSPIDKVIEIKGSFVVLLSLSAPPRNVFLLDNNGQTLWKIEGYGTKDQGDIPFANIWINQEGNLMAGNWVGVDCEVDLQSGRILQKIFTK